MQNDVRLAIYNACKSLNIPVYDYWVTDESFPYCIMGEISVTDTYYKLNNMYEVSVQIHLFEKSKGKTRINGYVESLRDAYKSIDGIDKRFTSRIIEDIEPSVNHGIVVLRFKTN